MSQSDSILEMSKTESGRCQMKSDGSLDYLCSNLFTEYSKTSLSLARALRNSCAGNVQNAGYLMEMNVIPCIAKYCREVALLKSDLHDDHDDSTNADSNNTASQDRRSIQERELFVLSLCQFLSNFAGCSEASSLFLWSPSFGENGFRDALAAAATVKSRACIAAVISSIYNSIKQIGLVEGLNQMKDEGKNEGLTRLCSNRGLASQLLLCASPTTNSVTNIPAASTAAATTASIAAASTAAATAATATATAASAAVSTAAISNTSHSSSSSPPSASPSSSSTSTAAAAVGCPPNDPVLEWLHILFFYLLKHEKASLMKMFITLQPRAVGENVWDFDVNDINEGNSGEGVNSFVEPEENGINAELEERAVLTHEQVMFLLF